MTETEIQQLMKPTRQKACHTMNAYVCVYRHPIPGHHDRSHTESAAQNNATLRRFLDVYDDPNCFYDWGDDPSFFAASELLGDVRDATWGVCRTDVRKALHPGDYVVFFCARLVGGAVWEYLYIGIGTVLPGLTRETIWSNDHYAKYRDFFNILARSSDGVLEQHETFHHYHEDWLKRCEAPYWVFAHDHSQFNLVNPLHVATYTGTKGTVETWHSAQNQQVARLEALLFPPSSSARRLRTSHPQIPHRHINLREHLGHHINLKELRPSLMELATGPS